MIVKLLKYAACAAFILGLACGTGSAQSRQKSVHTEPTLAIQNTPTPAPPTTLVKIYSNLGPSPSDNYGDGGGFYVLGSANTMFAGEQWIGAPFTPTKASHVVELAVPIGEFMVGSPGAYTLGLYSDNGITGVGTLLGSGSATATANYNSCCTLSTVHFLLPGIAVAAQTRYWVVATSNDTINPAFTAVWDSSNDFVIGIDVEQLGWGTIPDGVPALEVLGTQP